MQISYVETDKAKMRSYQMSSIPQKNVNHQV